MAHDTASDPAADRLPRTATPDRYDLVIATDLDAGTFTGEVAIHLDVHEATSVLVCNAAELDIHGASVDADGASVTGAIRLDVEREQLHVELPEPIGPGRAVLRVAFGAELNRQLRGFYRSSWTDDDGTEQTLAVTQFEPTDARRAFPCWDEPDRKAVFAVALDVADGLVGVSNSAELGRDRLPDGRVRIRFADTMPMSTYLVAFVVGPLAITRTVDAGGVPLRVVCRPGQERLAEFALDVGAFALGWFADYYGIAYPGQKLDMAAVPDFAFGAMENLGCVVYRETLLLVDPASATQAELAAVLDVIAHELAHMWFGDLVTMRWWNGIWLNEAFATFMEMRCAEAYRPEWERWMTFGRERTEAFEVDALAATRPIEFPVHRPADAEAMFDTLTYQKGSAVVRMLEQYLGADAFRDGIRRYLQAHQYGSTETTDLWDALEEETGEPIRAMMDTWIFQGGFPLVSVRAEGDSVIVEQQRFRYDREVDGTTWHVPIVLRDPASTQRVLLDDRRTTAAVTGAPVVANAGGHAFYRVAYDDALRAALLDHLGDLSPLERYAVLDDTQALLLRGDLGPGELASLIDRLVDTGERDLSVWQLGVGALDSLHRATRPEDGEVVSAWICERLGRVTHSLGTAGPGDDDRTRALRGLLLGTRGVHGDPDALALGRTTFAAALADAGTVDPELAAGALRAVSTHATSEDAEAILDRFRHGATPQEQIRHLYALGNARDPELFDRYLALCATEEVRAQNLAFAYAAAIRNRVHADRAWDAVEVQWSTIVERLPFTMLHRLVGGVTSISDPGLAERVAAFLGRQDVPHANALIAQHMERMRTLVALRERSGADVARSLP